MGDHFGIVRQAVEGLSRAQPLPLEIRPADICLTGTQIDSAAAAAAMAESGVDCIVTLGGDGTNRMVAKESGDIPLIPVSTGTNNVFSVMVEGTIAGLAAGVVAAGAATSPGVQRRTKKLVIEKDNRPVDIALVDAVVLDSRFIGSRAVWNVAGIRQIVLTREEPHNIGISSIGGHISPVGPFERKGLAIDCTSPTSTVLAPIAPGLIVPVPFGTTRELQIGEAVEIVRTPCLIAVDGEREIEVGADAGVGIRLSSEGPMVVDIKAALAEAAARGYFRR